jgi:uncharacterized membrane protein
MFGQELIIAGYVGPQEILMSVLMILVPVIIVIVLLRWLGAWMFRINDVMKHQKEMIEILKTINQKQEQILNSRLKETEE